MLKNGTLTEAEAIGFIHMKPETVRIIKEREPGKTDIISQAETSGKKAAKNTAMLVPLLPNTYLSSVDVKAYIFPNGIEVKSLITTDDKCGVEVEALTAVCATLLTLFEKFKTIDPSLVVSDIKILRRTTIV
ncbi:MAG TPA: cyclic pyranopterin monophosphate synthase MoaC [Bacteroidales bacterium]|nr:cyclic pyranopterin monophosphate synthase MoaC [Bacteroidales bacterium]